MFGKHKRSDDGKLLDLEGKVAAIMRSQAVIEFQLDGTVITANDNFLNALGYSLGEVQGRKHSMFVSPDQARSAEYQAFWRRLNAGEFVSDKFKRLGKGGREVWIQASYNPVLDAHGRPYKVIKFAADITQQENERARAEVELARAAQEQGGVVAALAESLKRLSAGDLTARVDAQFSGGYQAIKDDFNQAIDSLREAMSSIAGATGGINSGSDEISSASDDLSRRTEQQAASLEQTAAALDQITATVKRSAEGARQASTAASGARVDATRSGEVMRDAVAAMGEIEKSSGQITQIIGVIDEIAFQTNLLALNAGVEAARAGDAGKGFAVVAQEVRALAQRSAEAAKEIKALIASSRSQVEHGVKLVGDTGKALTGIVSKVTEIDELISEIARSSQEQATGLNQVNTAVNQMDQVTQQNAAMVEEATAAAATLKSQAGDLAQLIGRFETGVAAQARRPQPAKAGRHAPATRNPVHEQRAKAARFAAGGAASRPAAAAAQWEEF